MADERHEWFVAQVSRHRTALHRHLCKFMSGAEDVEDVVQETVVRVYALADFRCVGSPKALLLRIGQNLAVERTRRGGTRARDSVGDLEPLNEQIDARRRLESFCAAVERLPPLCRRVFVLRKVFRLSHAEISQVLNVSHRTIEKHLANGLVRCRDYLRELGLLETMGPKLKPGRVRRLRDSGDAE